MACNLSPQGQQRLIRALTVIFSVLVIVVAVFNFMSKDHSFTVQSFVINIYRIIFALVMLLAEMNIQFVFNKLGLLRHTFGKGMYLTFMGCICIEGFALGTFIGLGVLGIGLFLMCCSSRLQGDPKAQEAPAVNKNEVIA